MASALFVLDVKGKSLITRNYRQDVPYSVTETFIQKVIDEEDANMKPVFEVGGHSFVWIQHNNLYFLLVAKINCNVTMLVLTLHKIVEVFKEYMSNVTEESIRDNFVIVYELLDEMLDFGYPQFTESKILKDYITQESFKLMLRRLADDDGEMPKDLPVAMTGAAGTCSWRPHGIKYRKNEVFLDVVESVNLLVNSRGQTLHSEIHGALKMRAYLSGMPELKLGLNDKVLFEATGRRAKGRTVDLEDIKFHQCVKLNRFETDRTISFIPPDGAFDLMSYRLNTKVKPLISIESAVERTGARIDFMIKARSQFKKSSTASGVEILIPVPPDVDTPVLKSSTGTVKYAPDRDCVVWSVKVFAGGKEFVCRATFGLPTIRQKEVDSSQHDKRPITVKFEIPYFTVSGFQVRYLKVLERSGYESLPWVRYITKSGDYQIRM
eukprot:TRINITY_DN7283_c0_g4_i2.p1 TRINITY_DN7283_c0_g4~~TRINITY_DN7283_c0_g4_i2.p1  ORF type:complete len:437 (+),score=117.68 TRINITY_DN7283_c0_g4_i2:264-1574(+)